MLHKLLNKLEDPNIPLLGPNVKLLKFWGLLIPSNKWWRLFYFFLHTSLIVFTATAWVDVWFIKNDMNLLLINLKVTLLATVTVAKQCSLILFQNHWIEIIDYVTKSDITQRRDDHLKKKEIIQKYTKHCRRMTVLSLSLMYTTVVFVMIQPIYKYLFIQSYRTNVRNGTEPYAQVVSSWVPFDKNTLAGHLAACAFQSYSSTCGGGWITAFDSTAIGIMAFFKGELELLTVDSGRLFDGESNERLNRLKDCHKRHVELIRYCRLFDSCLSPVMLLYVFVCSVMICSTAYQLNSETSPLQQLITAEYLIFAVAQLFMFCWHSNEVFYISANLLREPYQSRWYTMSVRQQRDMNMLCEQFNKTIVFSAGPFTNLTVATFVNILKGAYSYYTLLSQQHNK